MTVTQMPNHYWQIGDVVPCFSSGQNGEEYDGKVLVVGRGVRDHEYRVRLADGSEAHRFLSKFANQRYLASKSRDPR